MKIIIDAMGGDNAPDQIVLGALEAAETLGTEITLVGRGEELLAAVKRGGFDTLPGGVEIANAEDVVDMHADPAHVVQQHRDSSMIVGLKMLADGQGDAFLSAGNTGALLTGATLVVKRIRGIRRAAFAPVMPLGTGSILVDAGANAECTPEFLLQFGCMGSFYAQRALGKEEPSVALLNNGVEEGKGDALHREAYTLLKRASERGLIRFVGNIEARDVPLSPADVIEGTAIFMSKQIKRAVKCNFLTMLGGLLCKRGFDEMKRMMDYRQVGGSLLLGVSKPVIKAHGSSDAVAIVGSVRQAMNAVSSGFCDEIRANIGAMNMEAGDAR